MARPEPVGYHGRVRARLLAPLALAPFVTFACAGADAVDDGVPDFHAHEASGEGAGEVRLGETSSALVASDPIGKAVGETCSTGVADPLVKQLVEEIQCLRPGTMGVITGIPKVTIVRGVSPYLQLPAVESLKRVAAAQGAAFQVNSGLRTLPEQFMLYRWFQAGRCDITRAAPPGQSNHESGLALDIQQYAATRPAFQANGWTWLGGNDPWHFDFRGGGTVALGGLSVQAFQRLWNRNRPNDRIAEDGAYGPQTEARVAQAPIGGFPIGASCGDSGAPDAGADGAVETSDAASPAGPATPSPAPTGGAEPTPAGDDDLPSAPARELDAETGCAAAPGSRSGGGAPAAVGAAFALAAGLAGRRRTRAAARR